MKTMKHSLAMDMMDDDRGHQKREDNGVLENF
jgi:hypothetical protein